MSDRLRVGIPPATANVVGGTGHGNVWRHVLEGLREHVDFDLRERAPRFGDKPDIWLADGHTPPPKTRGAPLVVQVHEASWADPSLAGFLHPEFARALSAATESSVRAASAVITPSRASADQVKSAYEIEAVHAVHHGVDLDLFRPGLESPMDGRYVLYVGVIHPRKNLEAIREAMPAFPGHNLVIVGSPARDRPDPQEFLEAAYAPLPDGREPIRIDRPSDQELAALYSGASAFCLPSWFEGFGMPALEAMAAGAPTVVSNRGALPEFVGDAAIVVDPTNVEGGIRRAISEADDLREAGRARAQHYPWSRTVEGWLAVITQVASRQ